MENNFDWLSIMMLALPILIFFMISVLWEIRFVISEDDYTLWMPVIGLFLIVPVFIDIYKFFMFSDVGFLFAGSAILLVLAYVLLLRIFKFKLLDWGKVYLFEPDGYGIDCLSGNLAEGNFKFRAILENVSHPENARGKLFSVKIKKIDVFGFFPVVLETAV